MNAQQFIQSIQAGKTTPQQFQKISAPAKYTAVLQKLSQQEKADALAQFTQAALAKANETYSKMPCSKETLITDMSSLCPFNQ